MRCLPDGAEQTTIAYDADTKKLRIDISQSSLDSTIRYSYYRNLNALERLTTDQRFVTAQEAPFELAPGEALKLRVYLDCSVLDGGFRQRSTVHHATNISNSF